MTIGLRLRQVGLVLFRMALLLTLISGYARLGRAQGDAPWLEMTRDASDTGQSAGCLDRIKLAEQVQALLGAQTPPPDLVVVVSTRGEPGFSLRRSGVEKSQRTFDGLPASCEDQHRAYAVAIAISIEHSLAEEREQIEPPTQEAAETNEPVPIVTDGPLQQAAPQAEPEEDEPGAEASRRRSTKRVSFRLGAGGGILGGVLPKESFWGIGSLDILLGRAFSAGIGGGATPRVATDLDRGTVRSSMVAARLQGCFEPTWGMARPGVCLGIQGGRMAASATGLVGARRADSYWAAGVLRLGLRVPSRGPLGVHLSTDGYVNFLRPGVSLVVEEADDLQDNAPLVGYSGNLEFFWVFP